MLAAFVLLQAVFPSLFYGPRLALFDLYQYAAPRLEHASPVVIVAIDDASLKTIGQWPWPRQVKARLISTILAGKPMSVGVDMILPEADRQSPEEWLRYAGEMPRGLIDDLRKLPSHDAIFGQAIAAGPVMLGVGGLRLVEGKEDVGKFAPFRLMGGASTTPAVLPHFNAALRSIPVLDNAAAGHGLLSVDPDLDGVRTACAVDGFGDAAADGAGVVVRFVCERRCHRRRRRWPAQNSDASGRQRLGAFFTA
jgi:adenylate cyclase